MRSRYTAFVRRDDTYLIRSWHPETRPATLEIEPRQRWLGLKVVGTEGGRPEDSEGTVEFVARYKIDGRAYRLHEISRFVRLDGRWVYLDGDRGPSDSTSAR